MPSFGYYALKAKKCNEMLQKWEDNPLNYELNTIRAEAPNNSLANLFAQTVRYLIEKLEDKKNRKRSWNFDDIRDIVSDVKAQVLGANRGHLRCREILLKGIFGLKAFLGPKKLAKLEEAVATAVQEDRLIYEGVQQEAARLSLNTDTRIQMYFMDYPDREPHLLDDHLMTTYKDIMWHLTFQEIVQVPEVWTRCENREKQPYTASGRHWNFVVGHETIDKTVIDIVDMNTVSDNYIVALVDTGEKEIPVPIGLPMFGRDTCCSPACGSLQVHLESIWEDVRVEHARLFPSKNCMRDTPLDSRNFGSRRNELYVKVKVKSTRMQEDPRAATIETSA